MKDKLKFNDALTYLNNGEVLSRDSWENKKFIIKQVSSLVPPTIVPRMTSLPFKAKEYIMKNISVPQIYYHDQCLIMTVTDEGLTATSYQPTWEDMIAEDWMVIS